MSSLVEVSTPEVGVCSIALNRPEKRNALNIPMLAALCGALKEAEADAAVRVIVLRGNGPVFCAGLDMEEAADRELAHQSAELVSKALAGLYGSAKVTLAVVQGAAIAGGAGLMSACDIAVSTVDSKFGYPEVRRGLVAGLVMTFLRRQVAERHARELLLLGEIIDGERAEAMGLVTRAVPSDLLEETAAVMIRQILKGSPQALALTKRFFDSLHQRELQADLDQALALHVEVRQGGDAQEGMAAFFEKRNPRWAPDQ